MLVLWLLNLRGDDLLPCDCQELFPPDLQFAFISVELECQIFACVTSGDFDRVPTSNAGVRSVEKSEVLGRVGPIREESLWSESDFEAAVDAATLNFNVFFGEPEPFNLDLLVALKNEQSPVRLSNGAAVRGRSSSASGSR